MSQSTPPHIPVLLREVLNALAPRDGGIYLDGTFGAGGYTAAILEAADCRVIALDRDPTAIAAGQALKERFGDRLILIEGRFSRMEELARTARVDRLDGVVLDLGVSSMQLDEPERGFSFRADGPLDMRMEGAGGATPSAADIVNGWEEADLARLFRDLGEERHARRIARAIVQARADSPITRTGRLAALIREAVPASADTRRIDPATRSFQALRLEVNDELGELDRALDAAEALLATGGRLVVVTFHSLEDRRVKQFLRARSGTAGRPSRHLPEKSGPAPAFTLLTRKAIEADADEIARNPRARSARLRAAIREEASA